MKSTIFPDEILLNIQHLAPNYFTQWKLKNALGWPVTDFALNRPQIELKPNTFSVFRVKIPISNEKYYEITQWDQEQAIHLYITQPWGLQIITWKNRKESCIFHQNLSSAS